jgi:two-component system, LuxR family, sensor kinase FixL
MRSVTRYALAVTAFIGSLVFRYALRDTLGLKVPYLQFYPAIIIAAWYGGLGPGVLVTALSALAAMYFLLPPWGLGVADPADQLSLAVFAATGLVIAVLNHRLHMAQEAQRVAAATATSRAERLDAILDTTADGSIVIDAQGNIEAFNRGVQRLFGYPEAEVLGHDLSTRANLEGALGASEARWRAIVDSAVDGIVVINAHGLVEAFNPAAERLFGYTAAEVIGRNVDTLMPSPYREEHDTYLARYLATGRAKVIGVGREVQGRRKDGSTFPLHLSVGAFTIQGERKFTGILHDLSQRVELEGQLREQAALAKLGEMAAVIAHEVKNPLAGIRGAVQVLGRSATADSTTSQVLQEIVSRIDSLDQMIKDLLLFARPPKPRRTPTEVVPLVSATASLLQQDPALREVDIEVEGAAPPVSADPDMLRIVFQNLLINGAHAMQGKGKIRVAVSVADGACQITFADRGPGIPPEIRQKIFTPFFTTKARGSGLGLPTAKRLIDAHNGNITVECPPSGGTSVLIRLPLR